MEADSNSFAVNERESLGIPFAYLDFQGLQLIGIYMRHAAYYADDRQRHINIAFRKGGPPHKLNCRRDGQVAYRVPVNMVREADPTKLAAACASRSPVDTGGQPAIAALRQTPGLAGAGRSAAHRC